MLFLPTFLGANLLLAMRRPILLAADLAYTLAIIVIATLGLPFSFLLSLSCLVVTFLGAEHLSVACRDKLFPTVGTDLLHNDFAAVFSDFLRLAPFPSGFLSRPLSG